MKLIGRKKDKESIYRAQAQGSAVIYGVTLVCSFIACSLAISWLFSWNRVEPPADAVIHEKMGADGCFPIEAQKKSLAAAPGDYDVLLLARWNLNGLCSLKPDRPACARVARGSNDITTTVRGFWPIRDGCERDQGDSAGAVGHHWPQYCVDTSGYLNGTAFGLLAAASPTPSVCSHEQHWPAEYCALLNELQSVWPDISTSAARALSGYDATLLPRAEKAVLSQHSSAQKTVSLQRRGGFAPPELGPIGESPREPKAPKKSRGPGNHLDHELDDHATGEAWGLAWSRHGSCSGLHAKAYFHAALAAYSAVLETDNFGAKTLIGPAWPNARAPGNPTRSSSSGWPFHKHFTLKELAGFFGGPYATSFQCERDKNGDFFLVSMKQCVRSVDGGPEDDGEGSVKFVPAVCPRWVTDDSSAKSCTPEEGGEGGRARVWLGRPAASAFGNPTSKN